MRSHTGIFKQCKESDCHFRTDVVGVWNKHKREHFQKKEIRCPKEHCRMILKNNVNSVQKHIESHSGVFEFCDECDFSTDRKREFDEHTKNKHPEPVFQDQQCSVRSFSSFCPIFILLSFDTNYGFLYLLLLAILGEIL
jgi:hypothetical protein